MAARAKSDAVVHSTRSITPRILDVLAELRQAGKPIVMSVNRTDFVVEDEGSYRHLVALIDRLETIGGIREALQDVEAGRTLTLDEFKSEVRQRHGIPD
jgi:phosphohistidine swiveling domain-containing protein